MNHDILKSVIYDWHEVIRSAVINPREYTPDTSVNRIFVGPRRAGKSTMLYALVRTLVDQGAGWDSIIFINFEDERLSEFSLADFNDIMSVQAELSDEESWFFFDEIQNIPGWEKFARRIADSGRHVFITGSNARMLSREMESVLGGRYLSSFIEPYSFSEFLNASGVAYGKREKLSTAGRGSIQRAFGEYLRFGGFPEILHLSSKREYLSSICGKILLGDIVARNGIRNDRALRLTIKKIAESVRNEISFSRLHNMLRSIGLSISKDTVISYVGHAEDACLIFPIRNKFAEFSEREGNPKYYFCDNGILGLFLSDSEPALLENLIALHLRRRYGEVFFLKSPKYGIDVDFFVPETKTAVQVAWRLSDEAREREFRNLLKLNNTFKDAERLVVITADSAPVENVPEGVDVIPAFWFLLEG
ncbi:MAG: ATP-binding protein [Mailhella sp.]|nr:ATP-binding protein [Mailhella sp.]